MTAFYLRSRPTANWVTGHAYSLGDRVVATSSTAFLGIHFEVTTAGTSSGSEPSWNSTVGGTTTDSGGVVWTTRGSAQAWQASKAYALGDRVIKVSRTSLNSASSCVWKCTTAGTSGGTEPSWPTSITSGTTTQTDGGVTWTAMACKTWDDANPFLDALLKDTANSSIKVAAGDTIYVSKTHAEQTTPSNFAALTITFPGTAVSPNLVICCDDTAQPSTPTAVATSASIAVAAAASFSAMQVSGHAYIYGIAFQNLSANSGSHMQFGTNNVSSNGLKLDSCALSIANQSSAAYTFGAGSSVQHDKLELINTTIAFANAAQTIYVQACEFSWRNTASALSGTMPTGGLFQGTNGGVGAGACSVSGVDLSALGSNAIFAGAYWNTSVRWKFTNCKLGTSFTLVTTSTSNIGYGTGIIDFINCDSGGTNYKLHRDHGSGKIDQELTDIMTGGASDGTTGISWKMVSNVNAQFAFPLESFPLAAWNDNSGSSKTATVEILTDSVTALNNDEIWLELEYLKDSGDPLGGFANNSKSNVLASNAAQATSTATWTTTGITHVMKQKLQVSFTPQQKGPVIGIVKLAKASATVYVNPVMSIA